MDRVTYFRSSINTPTERELFRESNFRERINWILLISLYLSILLNVVLYLKADSAERHVVGIMKQYETLVQINQSLVAKTPRR